MTKKILFVDDDANVLAAYRRQLSRRFDIHTALGATEGLDLLDREEPFAVVISDLRMPGMDGIEFLGRIEERAPVTIRMILTGNADLTAAINAVNDGHVFRFYTKPCPPETLAKAISAGLEQYRLVTSEKDLLEKTLVGSFKVLIDILSLTHPESFGKAKRLRLWARKAAHAIELPNDWQLDMAAMLSPLGEITIPPEIAARWRAGEILTDAEIEIVARVPEAGRDLIANIPRLQKVGKIVYYQNKGFDGSGFPKDWIAAEDIPVGARVLKVLSDLADLCPDREPLDADFDQLGQRDAIYDPTILSAIRIAFLGPSATPRDVSSPLILKQPVSALIAGDRLVSRIETRSGQLVLPAGNELSQVQVNMLKGLGHDDPVNEPIHVLRPGAEAAMINTNMVPGGDTGATATG